MAMPFKTLSSERRTRPRATWFDMLQSSDLHQQPGRGSRSARPSARRASSTASSRVRRTEKGKHRAAEVIRFIQCLTIPSGVGQGTLFVLRDWQKDFIRDLYEPHTGEGRRAVR